MIAQLLPAQAKFTLYHQYLFEESSHLWGGCYSSICQSLGFEYILLLYFSIHCLSIRGTVRRLTENHLKENDSNGPNIGLYGIEDTFRP